MHKFTVVLVASAASFTTVAHAQYDTGPPMDYHTMNFEFTEGWAAESFDGEAPASDSFSEFTLSLSDFSSERDEQSIGPAAFAFSPSVAVRDEVRLTFIERVRAESPQDARSLAAVPVFDQMEGALAPYDLTTANLSDTLMVYLNEIYHAARRLPVTPSVDLEAEREEAHAVRAQVAAALGAMRYDELNDAEMQRLSDTLTLQAYLAYSTRANCLSGAISPCDAFWAASEEQAESMLGAPAAQVMLTREGFVLPGGAPGRQASAPDQVTTGTSDAEVGDCGFPVREKSDRDAQMLLAATGGCGEYQGSRR